MKWDASDPEKVPAVNVVDNNTVSVSPRGVVVGLMVFELFSDHCSVQPFGGRENIDKRALPTF